MSADDQSRRQASVAAPRVLLVAVLVACSVGVAGCGGASKSSSTSAAAAATTSAASSSSAASGGRRGVVTIRMATVAAPGNPSVGVIQTFGFAPGGGQSVDPPKPPKDTGIYKNCSDAPPSSSKRCLTVGGVNYTYGIGEYDITVSQYVTYLNTVDPHGHNPHDFYNDDMSPTVWSQYGSIRYSSSAKTGAHYSVAYPQWAEKPFNFTDFRRAIRFVNSLDNGKILARTQSSSGTFKYVTYTVQLSRNTETGMYDVANPGTTRKRSSGFVLPSNDEWVKAAYYDPKHGGTYSYWAYPTGPFNPPNVAKLNPGTGDVENASDQPLSTYNPNDPNSANDTPGSPPGTAPTWCPYQAGSSCGKVFPADIPQTGANLPKQYQGNVSTVGQDKTPSPWGTYDQGGNEVQILDSLAPQPPGYNFLRNWRYYHGGVVNAPAYQLEISAFGYNPGNQEFEHVYPWEGFRTGVIGNPQ